VDANTVDFKCRHVTNQDCDAFSVNAIHQFPSVDTWNKNLKKINLFEFFGC
jgi:hypothetical protein